MLHHYCRTNRQMSTSMVSPNQPRHKETVLRILSETKSSTYLFLVGVDYCSVNVPLTILIQVGSVSAFSVIFITGMSIAAVSQLFSSNVECLCLIQYLQLKCLWLQFSSCFQCFQLVRAASTFPLVNLTKVSTAAHSMYFPKSSVPTRISTDPGHGTRIVGGGILFYYAFFTPTAECRVLGTVEAFSLCVFTSIKSPRGPPWNEGHRPKVRH